MDQSAPALAPAPPRRGLEVLAVLGVSLGMSAIFALLSFLRTQLTVPGGFAHAQVTIVAQRATAQPVLDLLDALAAVLDGVLPAFLALVLLQRDPGGPGFGIGLDRLRLRELGQGAALCALVGIPGLALVWAAHSLGINATLNVVEFPDVWYRVPVLLLDAAQNGVVEEVVVTAFLLTRLRQLGWAPARAIAAESLLRGAYHLYQGYGGFLGNLVMGVLFGWLFQRTRRVVPLLLAHVLLDAISFVGYVYLHGRIHWL